MGQTTLIVMFSRIPWGLRGQEYLELEFAKAFLLQKSMSCDPWMRSTHALYVVHGFNFVLFL